jgi:hypothetical protein
MPTHARPSARRRFAGAALAFCLALASAASASAAQIAVGTLDAQTGRFKVNESALSKTFGDGTPVGRFQIRYFSSMPYEISNGFFLVRSAPPAPGACRTEATRVSVHDGKAWLAVAIDLPKLVIDCGGLVPDCPMCQVRVDSDWSCGCFAGGSDTGLSCLSGVDTIPGDGFMHDWLPR